MPWIECPGGCESWACEKHREHVAECNCPPVEWLYERNVNPYEQEIPEAVQEEWDRIRECLTPEELEEAKWSW